MGIEKDIEQLFAMVLKKHHGNKAAAAGSLDINTVTFWGWATGKRKPPAALCKAIDNAGGKLLLPGEPEPPAREDRDVESVRSQEAEFARLREAELARLRERVESLTRENVLLHKLVNKYEDDEVEKKGGEKNQRTYIYRSIRAPAFKDTE